jgi:sugar phosphate isomerase/epimerase
VCVLCLSGPLGARSADRGRSIVVDGLRHVADAAREAGIRFGFEPIHPAQQDTAGFVCTLADALALLEEAGVDGEVGIMADAFNLAREDPHDVARVAAHLTGLHIADVPLAETPGVRVLPGEGQGVAAELVAALRGVGWDGWLDVEIFSTPDAFWALPVDEAARRSHAAVSTLL